MLMLMFIFKLKPCQNTILEECESFLQLIVEKRKIGLCFSPIKLILDFIKHTKMPPTNLNF